MPKPIPEILEHIRVGSYGMRDDLPKWYDLKALAEETIKLQAAVSGPFDMILPCPACGTLHVDEAKPLACEDCGHFQSSHNYDPSWFCEPGCDCRKFNPWLNPPHKSHRCGNCNIVWRPADVPTNGVAEIKTKGEHDTWSVHIQSAG